LAACGGDEETLASIVQSFQMHLPQQLSVIVQALRNQDALEMREAAHKLAGVVAAFSEVTAQAASNLEELAASSRVADFERAANHLQELCQKLQDELAHVSLSNLIGRAGRA